MKLDGNTIQQYSPYDLCLYNWYNMYPTHSSGTSNVQWSIMSNFSGASIQSSSFNQATISSGSYQGNFEAKATSTNACGSTDHIYDFNANPCGYSVYSISPNPAKDEFSINFGSDLEEKNIPEQFDLIAETAYGSGKAVHSFDMRSQVALNQAKSSHKLTFDVKNLPRGRYILRVMKEKYDKVETHRIVLE